MDRYVVIGNPVEHSRSPQIHRLFARQTGQSLRYDRLLSPIDDFAGSVRQFCAKGGKGANVTLPFKLEALALCDRASERARRAGAVNTLSFADDGLILGDNSDGIGLVNDLEANLGVTLRGLRVLILGAGGAVRGVLQPLLESAPAMICIANRTPAKADALAQAFTGEIPITACGYEALADENFDLIINGTSSGLEAEMPPLPEDVLAPGGVCYDMLYGPSPSPFLCWAEKQGASMYVDGLGMLVEQAAESFRIWRGVKPDTGAVLRQLRAEV
jgi:shikimate dehydrogenase